MTRDPSIPAREVAIAVTFPSFMPMSPVAELSLVMILPPRITRSKSMRFLPDQHATSPVAGGFSFLVGLVEVSRSGPARFAAAGDIGQLSLIRHVSRIVMLVRSAIR